MREEHLAAQLREPVHGVAEVEFETLHLAPVLGYALARDLKHMR